MTRKIKVIYQYKATTESELSIEPNQILTLLDDSGDWWLAENNNSQKGYIPRNFVEEIFNQNLDPQIQNSTQSQTKPSTKSTFCTVKTEYTAQRDDELSITPGLKIQVLEKSDDGWWLGRADGRDGWFPANFVEELAFTDEVSVNSSSLIPDVQVNKLHDVKCLFPFKGQSNELSFEANQILEIVEKPNDTQNWWLARNPKTGETGLIPHNYVEVLEPKNYNFSSGGDILIATTSGGSITDKCYFRAGIKRKEAEDLLTNKTVGQFLVRASESIPSQYSLSVKGDRQCRHFQIKFVESNQEWTIGNKKFNNFDNLIEHYSRLPIYLNKDSGETIVLTYSV